MSGFSFFSFCKNSFGDSDFKTHANKIILFKCKNLGILHFSNKEQFEPRKQ
jgi:hypothetical protein